VRDKGTFPTQFRRCPRNGELVRVSPSALHGFALNHYSFIDEREGGGPRPMSPETGLHPKER
jgi:hypothetical protein